MDGLFGDGRLPVDALHRSGGTSTNGSRPQVVMSARLMISACLAGGALALLGVLLGASLAGTIATAGAARLSPADLAYTLSAVASPPQVRASPIPEAVSPAVLNFTATSDTDVAFSEIEAASPDTVDAPVAATGRAAAPSKASVQSKDFESHICRLGAPARHKIIIHSVPKTGSTTLGAALGRLGYRDCAWNPDVWQKWGNALKKANQQVEGLRFNNISEKHKGLDSIKPSGFVRDTRHCDSASDFPLGHDQVDLRVKTIIWPRAKYIWLNRSEDAWLDSHWRWEHRTNKSFKPDDPGLASQRKANAERDRQRKAAALAQILELQAIAPQSVLIMAVEDGWTPLLRFLFDPSGGCASPGAWPHKIPHGVD
eukprot:CAMPEP_0115169488 /NCGR_PEP_ID=MMETSP0270-20121206/1294_1 /TAXON_ID=71861 /ORGANISM="Scrippsiella trochoidea, Strain CCMP3099" /LENGTH=369 /DNA_ID=CAMNT_0002582187 /DNA_START=12 /DNA_END=1119 /DNA_ORIENTATION=-